MLVVLDISTHEEHLSQPLKADNKQAKIALTFLIPYIGTLNVTNKNNRFIFIFVLEGPEYNVISIPPGADELESLKAETKRIFTEDGFILQADYPFKFKPNFSTLENIIETELGRGRQVSFKQDDTLRDLLDFKSKVINDEYNISGYPVDILSFDIISFEANNAEGMIFRGGRTVLLHNLTMDVDRGVKYIEIIRGGVQGFMMSSDDFISDIIFNLVN